MHVENLKNIFEKVMDSFKFQAVTVLLSIEEI